MQPFLGPWPSAWSLAMAFAIGLGLGAFFFGGLWWTVKRLTESEHPALLFAGSFVLRTAVVILGIYVASGNEWPRIAVCVAGFIAARVLLTRLWGPARIVKSLSEANSRAA